MTLTYSASSLEELANLFDHKAAHARSQSDLATTNTDKAMLRSEASTWSRAAAILRQTKLEPKS